MKLGGYKTDNLRIARLEIMEFVCKRWSRNLGEIEIFNLIRFSILRHVSHLIFNFVPNELLNVKIEVQIQLNSKLDFNWSLLFHHVSI